MRDGGTGQSPVGVFAGHADGIASLATRGDDRYVLSNSKDQTIKLWDVRRFSDTQAAEVSSFKFIQ